MVMESTTLSPFLVGVLERYGIKRSPVMLLEIAQTNVCIFAGTSNLNDP